jgi:hypothetical protein
VPIVLHASDTAAEPSPPAEAVRRVANGQHTIRMECEGDVCVDKLAVKAIPELVHCGLNTSSIKSYGPFDVPFIKRDVLPLRWCWLAE